MPRERLPHLMMAFAHLVSRLSTCRRLQVGCVLTDDRMEQILGYGYNGNAMGLPNECDSDVPGNCGCFLAGSKVETESGARVRIEKIRVGDSVLTHLGRYRRVTKLFRHRYVGDIIMLDTESKLESSGNNGARRKSATPEHPFLTPDGWVPLGQLSIGDHIAVVARDCECGEPIPYYRAECGICSRLSSKTAATREQMRQRMISNNPMGNTVKTYNQSTIAMMMRICGKMKGSTRRVYDEVNIVADEWRSRGYRCVVIDHCVRPDFIAIKNGLVIGVEVEKRPRRVTKYDKHPHIACQYDHIEWLLANRPVKYERVNEKFVWVRISHLSRFPVDHPVYNLEVEEDQSFVCQRAVVHNCVHAELNALLKADRPIVAFVTDTPCVTCAKLFINKRVGHVYATREYRDPAGAQLLARAGIDVWLIPLGALSDS